MTIHVEDLKFQCILGILDFERVKEQDIIINLKLDYHYENAFINYAEVVECVKIHTKESKFLLIEDALLFLSTKLKEKFPLTNTLHMKITKPSILPDAKVSVSNTYNFNS
jgi:dihydroneopterin aldolase